ICCAFCFFPFSGYSPQGPRISTHLPLGRTRHLLSNRDDLRDLFAEYKKRLLDHGYEETIKWDYTFACFKSGELISGEARRYYRSLRETGSAPGSPFEAEQL